MVDPMGLDPTQREMARRLIATGGLSAEQEKYAKWFIHSDEMTDSLWGSEGGTSLQKQHYRNAQHNWSKLVGWGFVPSGYERWGKDNLNYDDWMMNKEIELDPSYFKKLADSGKTKYFLEINIKSDLVRTERGAADSSGNAGFGHAEFGLIKVGSGTVTHERAGLGPRGQPSVGIIPGTSQPGSVYTAGHKYDAKAVFEVSEAQFQAASAYLSAQKALSAAGTLQWGQGSRVCTEFALDCLMAGGVNLKNTVIEYRKRAEPNLASVAGGAWFMPSDVLKALENSNVGTSRRAQNESYRGK